MCVENESIRRRQQPPSQPSDLEDFVRLVFADMNAQDPPPRAPRPNRNRWIGQLPNHHIGNARDHLVAMQQRHIAMQQRQFERAMQRARDGDDDAE